MPSKYQQLKQLPVVYDDAHSHTYTVCPFCTKGVRTDNYPSHLKTELKKLKVTDADSMEKHLNQDPNNLWSSFGTLNILVKTTTLSNNTLHYHKGVCFDCHRVIVNKPTTLSNTEVFEQHDCDKRKRTKTATIEHVKTIVTLSDESKLLRDIITSCEKVVEKHTFLSNEQKTELAYEYKKVKEIETEQKDILFGLFKNTLQYFIPKIKTRIVTKPSDDSWFRESTIMFDAFDDLNDVSDIKERIVEQLEIAQNFDKEKLEIFEKLKLQAKKDARSTYKEEIDNLEEDKRCLQNQVEDLKTELKYACMKKY
jgi:hypothetical protein